MSNPTTTSQLKFAATARGSKWFDESAMRFFNSKLEPEIYALPANESGDVRGLFISSEKPGDAVIQGVWTSTPRAWSVRIFVLSDDSFSIDTVGDFMGHETLELAQAAALDFVKRATE